jgi:hypothetical protein
MPQCASNSSLTRAVSLVLLLVSAAAGQQELKFEVASIRPSTPESRSRRGGVQGNHYENYNSSLRLLIVTAYDTLDHQLIVPDWLSRDMSLKAQRLRHRCHPAARGGPAAGTPAAAEPAAERFGLRVHRENRPMDVYEVVPAKGGHTMKPVPADTKNGSERLPGRIARYTGEPLVWIQGLVGVHSDRPLVFDIPGRYELLLNMGAATPPPTPPGPEPIPRPPSPSWPTCWNRPD